MYCKRHLVKMRVMAELGCSYSGVPSCNLIDGGIPRDHLMNLAVAHGCHGDLNGISESTDFSQSVYKSRYLCRARGCSLRCAIVHRRRDEPKRWPRQNNSKYEHARHNSGHAKQEDRNGTKESIQGILLYWKQCGRQ